MKTFSKTFGKAAVAFSLVGLLSSVAMADSIDDEIAKLKKENELLELKKKNAKLQKGSGVEFSNVVETDDEDYRSSLNGFFVGAEVGYNTNVQNYMTISDPNSPLLSSSTYSLPINLAFGYQLYPWQNAGFKFKGYVGYANYNSEISSEKEKADFKSQAIHYGLEAEYLYDFIASQIHTFGVNIGIGYEFGTFVGQSFADTSLKGYTISTLTSSAGVHYYYNINHQFELKYRMAAYTGNWNETPVPYGQGTNYKYYTEPFGSILFAYNYKF